MNKQAASAVSKIVKIDEIELGAMKNEYPKKDCNDIMSTAINELIVINKKIY